MMALHIETSSYANALSIAEDLLRDKLVYDVNFFTGVKSLHLQNGSIAEGNETVMVAKTKSILYPMIEHSIRQKFGDNMPLMYSMPIIHMPSEQFEAIRAETEKV